MPEPLLVAVMGETASGKTELAEALADRLDAVLINADAFQVYRGMDIGTAKSTNKSRYELLDIRDPNESFGVGEWVGLATAKILATERPVVVVGGTGLYIRALFEGYGAMKPAPTPELRAELDTLELDELIVRLETLGFETDRLDLKNRVRVQRALERSLTPGAPQTPPGFVRYRHKFALRREPAEIERRISSRVNRMMSEGWPDEVVRLREAGFLRDDPGLRAHGYRHIWDVIQGTIDIEEASNLTTGEVRRYAKRQRTWLRKEPGLIWLESDDPLAEALETLL